jgi:hypothetical protein
MKRTLLYGGWILSLITGQHLNAQVSIADSSIHLFAVGVTYGFYLPKKDLSKRFGNHGQIGMDLFYKSKRNWAIGLSGHFLFGETVKEAPLLTFADPQLHVFFNQYGEPVLPNFLERGFVGFVELKKLFGQFPFKKDNPNSGIFFNVAPGYLFHKIHIVAPELTFLTREMKRGYDRLSGGYGGKMALGYLHFGSKYLINYVIAFDFQYFETHSLRKYQFDKEGAFDEKRQDVAIGFHVGWYFPIYHRAPEKYYYY